MEYKHFYAKRKLLDRTIEFKCVYNDRENQIIATLPEVLQQNILNWELEPKWFFVIDCNINKVHDKQKHMTEEYFNKFINKVMKAIKDEHLERIIVSEKTAISRLFSTTYRLDSLLLKDIYYDLKPYNFEKTYSRFGWTTKLIGDLEPIPYESIK